MNRFLFILFFISVNMLSGQIDSDSVMGIPTANNNAEMNAVTGANQGSVLYNIAQKGLYMFDGTTWVPIAGNTGNTVGDIKYGVQTVDHSGWYILNGRNTSSLSSNARSAANTLGFTSTLPNANNRVLKHPGTGENIGDTGGQVNTTLTRANLPNVNFTGTTSTSGNHRHTIPRRTRTLRVFNNVDSNVTSFANNGTTNTSTTGNHNHTATVSSGGSNQPFGRYQPYLVVNTFIYLGE